MTLEEAQAQLAAMTKERDDALADNKQLKENISRQNSYITKLENKSNSNIESAQKSATPTADTRFDPVVQAYLEKNMKRDTIEEAKAMIKTEITDEMFKAVEPDFNAFLEKNLKKENCTTAYIVDAFSLVMGRALRNKEHPINKIGKGTATPPATPNPTTNSSNVQAVQNTILNNTTPPIMTNKDVGAASGMPAGNGNQHQTTRDAFKSLKDRFANIGGNKFN
jgi:hypothetical protein